MPQTTRTVEEYIAACSEERQAILQRVRAAIRRAVPGAAEAISYKMPTYKLRGRPVIYFGAWKAHYSLYPASPELVAALKTELAPYEVEKGTIRFPYSRPVPAKLIERIARIRAREAAESERAYPAGPRPTVRS